MATETMWFRPRLRDQTLKLELCKAIEFPAFLIYIKTYVFDYSFDPCT